jgi:hypothetical protein
MNAQLTDSEAYTSLAGALDKFLNLEPLVNSIEAVLNDYRPARRLAVSFKLFYGRSFLLRLSALHLALSIGVIKLRKRWLSCQQPSR